MFDKKAWREANKEKIALQTKAYYESNKEKIKAYKKDWAKDNKEKLALKRKAYLEANKEKRKAYGKLWREANKGKIALYRRAYEKNKRKNDAVFKLEYNLRTRTNNALRSANAYKNERFCDLLGCTIAEAYAYIESLFTNGMTWDNIHIDHIRPCASFDLSKESERKKCFNYKNLAPLFAEDNLAKGAKYNGVNYRRS